MHPDGFPESRQIFVGSAWAGFTGLLLTVSSGLSSQRKYYQLRDSPMSLEKCTSWQPSYCYQLGLKGN
jgi:hypothetical protein